MRSSDTRGRLSACRHPQVTENEGLFLLDSWPISVLSVSS